MYIIETLLFYAENPKRIFLFVDFLLLCTILEYHIRNNWF